MKFQDYLKSRSACSPAVEWAGDRTLEQAWEECERGDWMLWLATKAPVAPTLIALAACDCAQTAWRYCDAKVLATLMHCDHVVREYCEGRADVEKVQAARQDVHNVYVTAAADGMTTAAHAAAAMAAAATVIMPPYMAMDTIRATAIAASLSITKDVGIVIAARKAAHIECCRLIRERIPLALIIAATTTVPQEEK